ncbi:MAG TPA: SAM-dependent chlorinase/fluorinase [Flavobacteriales bacterium]|nr:SAM-dependent chlorinase/fluorinase [Flavobacteriales bacterium]
MAIITLISDMGTSDHYVAAVKGAILSRMPQATIVDITHHILPFNNMHAAFVLRNAWPEFPAGTVHIIGVNPEAIGNTRHVALRHGGHYFIGADNGIFSLLFDEQPQEIIGLAPELDTAHLTFPSKHTFTKVACHLAQGGGLDELGERITDLQVQHHIRATITEDTIMGHVIHIDHYGNVFINITRDTYAAVARNRGCTLAFGRTRNNIRQIHNTYSDVPPGETVAFFGDSGYLEVALNKGVSGSGGGAAQLLGLKTNDVVRMEFAPVPNRTATPA